MSEVPVTPAAPPPPPPPPPPAATPSNQFDFAKPFTFVFDDPAWVNKILMGGLFYLAGFLIVGWFFILGYVARMTRNVIAGDPRPLPEWEDLGDYFAEGLRLAGVVLTYILPFIAIAFAFIVPMGLLSGVENRGVEAFSGCMASAMSCLLVPLSLAVMVFMPASLLFAIVEQRYSAGFEFARIWAFIKNNVGNYLLAVVVYLIARMLGGVGIFLLCIGVIFTGFWSFLVTAHGFAQTYRLAVTK